MFNGRLYQLITNELLLISNVFIDIALLSLVLNGLSNNLPPIWRQANTKTNADVF